MIVNKVICGQLKNVNTIAFDACRIYNWVIQQGKKLKHYLS